MIRRCHQADLEQICAIINDGANAYRDVIPADRWSDPYMSLEKLQHEIDEGVEFWGDDEEGRLLGVMGLQQLREAALIRHAYVRSANQKQGVGSRLLNHLLSLGKGPILVGTWASAIWAIRFYQKHGFKLVSPAEKERLLREYWTIPDRQIETSVVLQLTRTLRMRIHL